MAQQKDLSELQSDTDTLDKIAKAKTIQDILSILTAAGYNAEAAINEFNDHIKSYAPNLSDEELEQVSSGTPITLLTTAYTPVTTTTIAIIK
jgi:predicted ribosomally synthesized peptide with nif11-like leader